MSTKNLLIIFALISLIAMLLSIIDHKLNTDVHTHRLNQECIECHNNHDYITDVKPMASIPPPRNHTEQFRAYTHGKTAGNGLWNCIGCHKKQECIDCHNRPPTSHTANFIHPKGLGLERHVMLGRTGISSCQTCHIQMQNECISCHSTTIIEHWINSNQPLFNWEFKE